MDVNISKIQFMKFIKTYEEIVNDIQLGDYIIGYSAYADEKINNFLKNNIGKVVIIDENVFDVEYESNIDGHNGITNNVWTFNKFDDYVIYHSKNKKDLIDTLNTIKYNL